MKHLNRFIKAKNLDKQMVLDYLRGQDPRRTYPFYHSPLVPTFAGAIDIFELKQLEEIKVETQQVKEGCMWRLYNCMTSVRSVEQVLPKTETK